MRSTNRFNKGSGVYTCRCCTRKTRFTGRGANEDIRLCTECAYLGYLENLLTNYPYEFTASDANEVRRLVAALATHKGAKLTCWADLLTYANTVAAL